MRTLRDLVMEQDVSKLTREELISRNAMVELATWCIERLPLLERGRKVGFRMALSPDAISAIEAALPHPDGSFVVRNILHVDD
jgi:hypothetical protein